MDDQDKWQKKGFPEWWRVGGQWSTDGTWVELVGVRKATGVESPKVMGTCLQRLQGWTSRRGVQEGTMGQGICTLEDGVLVWH